MWSLDGSAGGENKSRVREVGKLLKEMQCFAIPPIRTI